MTLPAGLSTVTVNAGPYVDAVGRPYSGRIVVTPSAALVQSSTGAVVLPGDVTARLDATGAASIVLPATDATGLTVSGFTYTASFDLRDSSGEQADRSPFAFALPAAAPVVDLDLLAPTETTAGVAIVAPAVLSVAGLTGSVSAAALVAALQSQIDAGFITPAELAAALAPYATTAAVTAALATLDGGTP